MNDAITNQIQDNLDRISAQETIKILFAIESGSRAWGFESKNSDFDVRFVYCRPTEDYLRIDTIRDVIELPIIDDLDINGWDLPKALGLLVKSNPPILEWLGSPIVYRQLPVAELLRKAAKDFFDPASTSYHYLSMATKNAKYLQNDLVLRKKYLYVLRPLLCIHWIQKYKTMPPMKFEDMLVLLREVNNGQIVNASIKELLVAKKAGAETDKQPRIDVLDTYIKEQLSLYQPAGFGKSKQPNYTLANELFHNILHELA